MQLWLNFFIFIFWLSLFGFLTNTNNFISILFFSEIIWIILYAIAVLLGLQTDDVTVLSISFFVLALAGIEFVVGFLLVILFKLYNLSFIFVNNEKKNKQYLYTLSNLYFFDKFFWK